MALMWRNLVAAPKTPQWKSSHWLRNASIGVMVGMVVLAVLGYAARPPTNSAGSEPPPVPTASDDGSAFESPSPSPTPVGQTLLSIKGTGPATSDPFAASGDAVDVTYDFTCTAEDSFTVNFYGAGASPILPDVLVSDFGTQGSGTTTENLNGATGPFTVEVDTQCSWSVTVLGQP
jgi:hypothetical protein